MQKSIRLSKQLYKLRLKCRDLARGKSKSFRLIVLLIEVENLLVPVTVFFKGDRGDISESELEAHLNKVKEELK